MGYEEYERGIGEVGEIRLNERNKLPKPKGRGILIQTVLAI